MRVERVIKGSCLNEMIPEREQQHLIEDVIDHIMVNEHLRVGKDGAYIWGATLMQVCEYENFRLFSLLKTPFLHSQVVMEFTREYLSKPMPLMSGGGMFWAAA